MQNPHDPRRQLGDILCRRAFLGRTAMGVGGMALSSLFGRQLSFAADALREEYFGWDRARFARAGEHNLLRARGQWALHEDVVRLRAERARRLDGST